MRTNVNTLRRVLILVAVTQALCIGMLFLMMAVEAAEMVQIYLPLVVGGEVVYTIPPPLPTPAPPPTPGG